MGKPRNPDNNTKARKGPKSPLPLEVVPVAKPSSKIFNLRNGVIAGVFAALIAVGIKLYPDDSKSGKAESDTNEPTQTAEIEKELLQTNLRIWIVRSAGNQLNNDLVNYSKKAIDQARKKIQSSNSNNDQDEEIQILRALLTDIEGDIGPSQNIGAINLDTSFSNLEKSYAEKIAGYTQEKPEDTALKDLSAKLTSLGIETSYAVMSKNPNAKTLIVIGQLHEGENGRNQELVNKSQDKIWSSITKIAKTFGPTLLHQEGLMENDKIENSQSPKFQHLRKSLVDKTKAALDSSDGKLQIVGFENLYLHQLRLLQTRIKQDATMQDLALMFENLKHREAADNIFISANVAKNQGSQDLGIVCIGNEHLDKSTKLPLEALLALRGYNVLVIKSKEATSHIEATKRQLQKALDDSLRKK